MSTRYVHVTGDDDNPTRDVTVEELGDGRFRLTIGDEVHEVSGRLTDRGIAVRNGARSLELSVDRRGETFKVRTDEGVVSHEVVDGRLFAMRSVLGGGPGAIQPELTSPMAGKVVLVQAEAGATYQEGETLLVIEAMKMENEIRAPAEVVVEEVRVAPGDLVNPGDVLLAFAVDAG